MFVQVSKLWAVVSNVYTWGAPNPFTLLSKSYTGHGWPASQNSVQKMDTRRCPKFRQGVELFDSGVAFFGSDVLAEADCFPLFCRERSHNPTGIGF